MHRVYCLNNDEEQKKYIRVQCQSCLQGEPHGHNRAGIQSVYMTMNSGGTGFQVFDRLYSSDLIVVIVLLL